MTAHFAQRFSFFLQTVAAAAILHVDGNFVVVDEGVRQGWTPGSDACLVDSELRPIVCGKVESARKLKAGVRIRTIPPYRIQKGQQVKLLGDIPAQHRTALQQVAPQTRSW
jgi:hypothetical protein